MLTTAKRFDLITAEPPPPKTAGIVNLYTREYFELMRDRRDAFLRTNPEVLQAACEALAELDLRPQLEQVRIPVLVLVGEHDEATPPPMSRELAAGLPNARLKIIPGCAHVPQLQSPQLFLEAIGDFIPEWSAAN